MRSHRRRIWASALAGTFVAALAGPAAAQSPRPSDFGSGWQGRPAAPPAGPIPALVLPPVGTPVGLPVSAHVPAPVAAPAPAPVLQPTAAPVGASGRAPVLPSATLPVAVPLINPTTPLVPIQTPSDTGMSSKPPAFTLPSPAAAAKDTAAKDPAAPAVSNDASTFAGFPSVQDAFSHLLPGNFKDTKYKWYGFVRMDAIYDARPMGSTDSFVTAAIPIPQGQGQNFVLTPRYTRLGFDTLTPLKDHPWEVKTRIEMDFFNGNTSGVFGSFPIRLRFAWIDVGPFLVGQAASLFMDYDVFPNVLDFQGPPGMVLMRQPIIAYRTDLADNLKLSVGIEHPYSDIQWLDGGEFVVNPGQGIITEAGVAKNINHLPDLTANLRYTYDYGHAQLAGVARKLTYQTADERTFDEYGYGVNLTGTLHPWAMMHGVPNSAEGRGPWEKSRFLGQYACGQGIARYVQDTNGLGLDATFDPVGGFQTLQTTGWFIAYEQWWTDKLASVFTYGQSRVDLPALMPGGTYKSADYGSANLIWLPVERLGLGIEFLYGSRENKDGAKGKNYRVQTGIQYRF